MLLNVVLLSGSAEFELAGFRAISEFLNIEGEDGVAALANNLRSHCFAISRAWLMKPSSNNGPTIANASFSSTSAVSM